MAPRNPTNNKEPLNLEKKTRLFLGKADSDTTKELQGSGDAQSHIDALNFRFNDTSKGQDKSAYSIGGEEVEHNSEGITDYKCIGSMNVGSKQVEFWAPYDANDGGIIRIDGVVMCRSVNFAIHPDRLLQWDTNNDAIGGEVYITDFFLQPMYFSIKDIIDNFGVTQKYFADFNINNYIISLILPPDNIVYDENPLVAVGTGGGLPTGQYCYSHRYVTESGDRTNWSVPTPLIFVPHTYQKPSNAQSYIGLKTLGNNPDPNLAGEFGVKMWFRANNVNDYDYIEIKRTAYNGGEAIDFAPPSYIVKRIPLQKGQFGLVYYVDSVSNQSDTLILTDQDSQDVLSAIKRAKAIRYFYNKIILGNIEYESRDITNEVTFLTSANGNTMCPIMQNIGSEGYKNAYTHAYRRMYMHGEKYGFYVVCWDANFSRSLAIPVPGFDNYEMPNKRDALSQTLGGDSLTYSKFWSRQASTRGQVEETFEVVDYKLGGTREPYADTQNNGKNILNRGNLQTQKLGVRANDVGYRPFYPQKPYETQGSDYSYTPTDAVSTDGLGAIGFPSQEQQNYNPYMFRPQYNALGMCLVGLDNIPSWATAFSVVRTKKAGKVVAQGMGFWKMNGATVWNDAAPAGGGQKGTGKKSRNKIAVQLPDDENGVVPFFLRDQILTNPSAFKIQMVEPLGFHSEILHFRSCSLNNPSKSSLPLVDSRLHADTQVDMVVHATVQCELDSGSTFGQRRIVGDDSFAPASQTGIQDTGDTNPSKTGYVCFGMWRNQINGSPTIGGQPFQLDGNYKFTIIGATLDTANEENQYHLIIELGDENGNPVDLYWEEGGNLDVGNFGSNQVRNFTEPVYIVNIIKDGASVPNLDIQSLLSTGNYVKIKALVGYSNGLANQVFELCGERNEDVGKLTPSSIDKYVWVEGNGNQEFFRWINISYLSAPDIATINADIANGTTNHNGLLLYGTYECSALTDYDVVFGSTHIPPVGARIEVRYDNREPVYVFGGDTTVGYSAFPVVHRSTQTSGGTGDQPGDNVSYGNMLKWNRFMPFLWWKLKPNYYILKNSKPPLLPVIQATDTLEPSTAGTNWCKASVIRQMVVLYNCQTYSHLPLCYTNFYPVVNYVMRPTAWNENKTPSQQNIYPQYEQDYPNEKDRWKLGGIRINQFNPDTFNLDYSKENITDVYTRVANILFVENTWFPNRIIWSYSRPIQKILAPNLKTFAPFSLFDISDHRGQIQRLYSFSHGGENVYAACEDDWCMVLTRKRTLSDLSGNTLGVTGNGQDTAFIQEQIWMSETKKGGLKGEFWKTFAENGDSAFYANYNGVFEFKKSSYGSEIVEITEGYFSQLFKNLCSRVQRNDIVFLEQELYGTYNTRNEEYWIRFKTQIPESEIVSVLTPVGMYDSVFGTSVPHYKIIKNVQSSSINLMPSSDKEITVLYRIEDNSAEGIDFYMNGTFMFTAQNGEFWKVSYKPTENPTFVFEKVNGELNEDRDVFLFAYSNKENAKGWIGVYDYDFDTFNSFDSKVYGQRSEDDGIKNYALGKGLLINGSKFTSRLFMTLNPELEQSFIFSRLRINSSEEVDVKFYNPDNMDVAVASLSGNDEKNYHAFENYIPRDTSAQKNRISNTHTIFQIIKQIANKQFFVNSITVMYNKIK